MWTIKERISVFLIIIMFMAILFTPARGYCVTLTGNILKTNNDELENALIFIYDYETAKSQGLQGTGANIGIVVISVDNNNLVALASTRKNIVLDEKQYPLDREYLLLISTIKSVKDFNYASFFIGATSAANYSNPSTYVKQTRWWDVESLPRVKFTSGTFNLGTVIAPAGVWLRGTIKDSAGYLKDVGVELYRDSNGVPEQIPFPFTRFVRTTEPDASNLNFRIGGVLTTTSYYIRLIGNNEGYIDTFLMDSADPNKPKKFTFTGNYNNPPYTLTERGAKIWGYIKDSNNNPVTKPMTIQGLSDNEAEPYPLYYVHDPNYARFNVLTDAEKYVYRIEPYYYNYNSDGKYELKGLPYEDHEYYLSAIEMALEGSNKVYATPVWYDGNDGTFDFNKAKKISLSGPTDSVRVDFNLNDIAEPVHIYPGDKIQEAIDSASDLDVIIIHPGTYRESINFSGKAITIKSTDPNDPNVVASTIIDGSKSGSVVTFNNGEYSNSILTGITIRNGHSNQGGGIYCASSPTIIQCIIEGNTASSEPPVWEDCGGGIYCAGNSSPRIINCIIKENTGCNGAGICCGGDSSPTISQCMVRGNTTTAWGGGGIGSRDRSSPLISQCTITENESATGGGGFGCIDQAKPTLTNCIITRNLNGEGIICWEETTPTIVNCTITGNQSSGGINCASSSATITNCILWNNDPFEIATDSQISYSDIQGGHEGTGNINADPLFIDPNLGDFHLRFNSPCIDAGTNISTVLVDKDGISRPQDGNGDGTLLFDIGAFEFANILPDIGINSINHDFGSLADGNSSEPLVMTISNTGNGDLDISAISLSDTTDFTLDLNGGPDPCGSTSFTIAPGGTGTLVVIFSPQSEGQK
ncbi:MAG: right-handed parallel beta-helix repeat-containing protein, partial [bacterium]